MNKNAITPKRIILILGITIFVIEGIIMIFLSNFQSIPFWFEGLIDSVILVIILFPILFYFVFKPMINERRELEESNDLKELLLDIITHDLKNPVGVINGFSGLLLASNPKDEMTQSIHHSSDTLLKVIDNATALTGIAMGETIKKQEIDLIRMLRDVKSGFDQLAKQADVEIEFQTPEELLVNANPIISEIFKNYLSNAIKYGKDGKRIIIGAVKQNGTILININDFGETIPVESGEAIFLRQARLDSPAIIKGRGLGLAIVKRIAEAHEAKVWVEPNEPTGNSFCFEIPDEL